MQKMVTSLFNCQVRKKNLSLFKSIFNHVSWDGMAFTQLRHDIDLTFYPGYYKAGIGTPQRLTH